MCVAPRGGDDRRCAARTRGRARAAAAARLGGAESRPACTYVDGRVAVPGAPRWLCCAQWTGMRGTVGLLALVLACSFWQHSVASNGDAAASYVALS